MDWNKVAFYYAISIMFNGINFAMAIASWGYFRSVYLLLGQVALWSAMGVVSMVGTMRKTKIRRDEESEIDWERVTGEYKEILEGKRCAVCKQEIKS